MQETSTPFKKTNDQLPSHLALPAEVIIRHGCSSETEDSELAIAKELNVSPVLARILVSRSIATVADARNFLYPNLRSHLPDPSEVKNIEKAARLLLEAVEDNTLITIYCDFDVDGLSAGAQLYLYLVSLGAKVNYYTPNRFAEGYGLVSSAIEKCVRGGTGLLVAVDCGVTSERELAYAKKLGLKTIVLDHHQMHALPPADILIDPVQDGCPFGKHQLCAAGLVWMLLIVLRKEVSVRWKEKLESKGLNVPDPKDFLDLAVLGTICDMVPLTGLNRLIAHRGIEALRNTSRPGLIALKEVASVSKGRLNAGHVSFAMGPRINAAGRLDDASQVFELLTTGNANRAKSLAQCVSKLNDKRKAIEEDMRLACLEMIAKEERFRDVPAFVLFGEDFHLGVVGIVAQRVVEHFNRPAAVMGYGETECRDGRKLIIRGSVRSIKGFDVAHVLQRLDSILLKHGGHAAAGGFSLLPENLEKFETEFVALARELITSEMSKRTRIADVQVTFDELTFELVDQLRMLEPYGIQNPPPLLVTEGVMVESVQSLANGHLKLRLSDGSNSLFALAWRFQGHPLLVKGKKVNIAHHPEINSYGGVSSVQLNVKEVWR